MTALSGTIIHLLDKTLTLIGKELDCEVKLGLVRVARDLGAALSRTSLQDPKEPIAPSDIPNDRTEVEYACTFKGLCRFKAPGTDDDSPWIAIARPAVVHKAFGSDRISSGVRFSGILLREAGRVHPYVDELELIPCKAKTVAPLGRLPSPQAAGSSAKAVSFVAHPPSDVVETGVVAPPPSPQAASYAAVVSSVAHPPPDAVERVVSADDTATVAHAGLVAPQTPRESLGRDSLARLSHSDKDVSKKDASAINMEDKLRAALRSPSDTPSKERVLSQQPAPPVIRKPVSAHHKSWSNSSSKNDTQTQTAGLSKDMQTQTESPEELALDKSAKHYDVVARDEFEEFETLSDMDRRFEEDMLEGGLGYFDV